MSHVDGSFLVLQSLDDVKDVLFYFFDVFGVDEGCDFADEFHEDSDGVGAEEGEGDAEVGVVLVEPDAF